LAETDDLEGSGGWDGIDDVGIWWEKADLDVWDGIERNALPFREWE
jgi:hypothetical protein